MSLCQQYLQNIYQNIKFKTGRTHHINETYGEILTPSVSNLIKMLKLTEDDVFYDLGSGVGKVALQFHLQSMIKKSVGIEILPHLHQISLDVHERVREDFKDTIDDSRQLNFMLGDFLKAPLNDATVILLASPCYQPDMLKEMAEMLNTLPAIRTVLSLRPLLAFEKLPFKKTIKVEGSWDSALCFCYQA